MSPARRRYERALGGALVLFGALALVPVIVFWVWVRQTYVVGLSVDTKGLLIGWTIIAVAALPMILGGFALMRRM
ncbi:MAG: hypothetical protein JSR60_12465 [Proteobacteria bacterium]|nr:hypothetical protein [Pseudomonadota bacterium]